MSGSMTEEKSKIDEADVKLRCGVYGEGSIFSVEINRNADVEVLQKASRLTLYLARKKGETTWMKHDHSMEGVLKGGIDTGYDKILFSWKLDEDYFGENFQPERKEIHVLVALPPDQARVTMVDRGWTAKWLSKFRKNQLAPHHLPRLGELADFVENELPEKITLYREIYNSWIAKMTSQSPELMAKLFNIDKLKHCVNFLLRVGSRIEYPTDPGGTQTSYISFWDDLIRNVLNFVLHDVGKSDRNSS